MVLDTTPAEELAAYPLPERLKNTLVLFIPMGIGVIVGFYEHRSAKRE